ncbi:hypothetical protein OIU79_025571 [Salix purpurea]|uniref:Uncharacterized protein n=1 Tax=Salix purpurea TaxID=77065 RepID=A0A9Q1A7J2_SALPP|nr:hypothetical protein OIU79_025571 [Salix purpurea]
MFYVKLDNIFTRIGKVLEHIFYLTLSEKEKQIPNFHAHPIHESSVRGYSTGFATICSGCFYICPNLIGTADKMEWRIVLSNRIGIVAFSRS